MSVLPQTFSRRKRQLSSQSGDVYQYDEVSSKLRVQTTQVLREGIGDYYTGQGNLGPTRQGYDLVVKIIRRDVGVHKLINNAKNAADELFKWMESSADTDSFLDAVESLLKIVDRVIRSNRIMLKYVTVPPDQTISEINERFQEEALGYQYVDGVMLKISAMHLHREVVLPTLRLLSEQRFAPANQEYRLAHEAYRYGRLEDCLVNCAKAFESVLKVIGKERSWPIAPTDPASKLIQAAKGGGLIRSYSEASLNHLVGLLESSTPTLRNKMAGHGAGSSPRIVPRSLASLQLHQTAAAILYFVEQDREISSSQSDGTSSSTL